MTALRRLARFAVITAALARGALRALLVGVLLSACGPGRELVMRVAPGVPSRTDSDAAVGSSRCNGAVPEVRSASGRWWPATPASAPCAHGCVTDDAGAYCAAADAAVSP
ncbi:MAG: hypothetical protein IPQ07_41055 [Myxococcales bacterium]|nr:hypothetical protein [Myxococcales bacterium]